MKFKNAYDMHTHSIHSFDGNDSIDSLCKSALNMGAAGIAITDHCDIDGVQDYKSLCSNQITDLICAKEKYSSSLDLIFGLEIGQGIYRKSAAEDVYNNYEYDFILGSIHNLENMEDFYFLDYKQNNVYELLDRYFSDLLELADWGYFDSMAHLTYPLRYIVAREHINVDMTRFASIIDDIFKTLIKNDKALEINTSGLFMDIRDTLPDISFIKRFKQLGGKYITVGSDSHYALKAFQGVERGIEIALESGFENITIYKNHTPILIPIERG